MVDYTGIAVLVTSVGTLITSLAGLVKVLRVEDKADKIHNTQHLLQQDMNGKVDQLVHEAHKTGALEALALSDEPEDE